MSDFDFVFLTETFSVNFPSHLFPMHDVFLSPGIRLSDATTARLSGGVALLIKKEKSVLVKQIHVELDNCVVLKLSRDLTGLDTDSVFIGMYLPPSQSLYYTDTEIDNGVALLEQCIIDIFEEFGELPIIICGDLNARTGGMNARDVQLLDDVVEDVCNENIIDDIHFRRVSKDVTLNEFGRYLLYVCEQFNLVVLNGLLPGDEDGNFTYISHSGSSIIDYFIMSRCLVHLGLQLSIVPKIDSKHMPVKMSLKLPSTVSGTDAKPKTYKVQKYIWNTEKSQQYFDTCSSDDVSSLFKDAVGLIDVDIEAALSKFTDGIRKAGHCMQKTVTVGKNKGSPWFDGECKNKRRLVRQCLRRYQKSNGTDARNLRIAYTKQRQEYKRFLKEKKAEHKNQIIKILEDSGKDPRKFWSTIKSVISKGSVPSAITSDEWFRHFYEVFNLDYTGVETSFDDSIRNEVDIELHGVSDILEVDIMQPEVLDAIRALKNNKAPGPDGLSGEFYKYAAPCVVEFLTQYFNKLFDTGTFPLGWSEAVIQPIHKKGDINSPDNYRGISLLNVSGKLYSYILNKRLTTWLEDNRLINETQAGFRKGYSTVDHIFTLLALIQKQLLTHGKLYAAFIDFKKAFDFVDRNRLWDILRKNGVKGRMYRAIKSMYSVVKARVRVGGDLTEPFMCPRGLKQGEICSPILFSLFINELANEIIQKGKHGISLSPDLIQMLIMLFADDVILLSFTITGLQHQLNILNDTANNLGLVVNLSKSNIVVFRNGGHLALREKWFYNGTRLAVVNQYKYLGVIFSTGLTFSYCLEDMASRAKKGVIGILKLLWTLAEQSPTLFFRLFDCQIQPMLTYGAEVWGIMADHSTIERVHLFAIKRLLNVSTRTPSALVYGETGRYPLYIITYVKCIKYWLNLVRMPENRLPIKAYKMLYALHSKNKNNWVSHVCFTLYRYGFGFVWENQGVCDVSNFIREFRQRLVDCFLQEWHSV